MTTTATPAPTSTHHEWCDPTACIPGRKYDPPIHRAAADVLEVPAWKAPYNWDGEVHSDSTVSGAATFKVRIEQFPAYLTADGRATTTVEVMHGGAIEDLTADQADALAAMLTGAAAKLREIEAGR